MNITFEHDELDFDLNNVFRTEYKLDYLGKLQNHLINDYRLRIKSRKRFQRKTA